MKRRRYSPQRFQPVSALRLSLPPATTAGTVAITLRRPSEEVWSIGELAKRGIFKSTRRSTAALDVTEQELLRLLAAQEYEAFMRLAVAARKNILVLGPTGSGKTTWTKALIREIPPSERLITIEDARKLVLDGRPNHVRLFYSKERSGLGPRDAEAAARVLSSDETRSDSPG